MQIAAALAQRLQIQFHRRQRLPGLVVQFARQPPPLLLLRFDQLARERVQAVARGQHLFVQLGPLNRRSRAVGDDLQQPQVLPREAPPGLRADVHHADYTLTRAQRRADQRPRLLSQHAGQAAGRGNFFQIVDDQRFVLRRDLADQALPKRDQRLVFNRVSTAIHAKRRAHDQMLLVCGQQQHGRRFAAQHLTDALQQLVQQLIQFQSAQRRVSHFLNCAQALNGCLGAQTFLPLAFEQFLFVFVALCFGAFQTGAQGRGQTRQFSLEHKIVEARLQRRHGQLHVRLFGQHQRGHIGIELARLPQQRDTVGPIRLRLDQQGIAALRHFLRQVFAASQHGELRAAKFGQQRLANQHAIISIVVGH